jgi:hypothetical protein
MENLVRNFLNLAKNTVKNSVNPTELKWARGGGGGGIVQKLSELLPLKKICQ